LIFLQKALSSASKSNPIKDLVARPGKFDVTTQIEVRLSGEVGQDYEKETLYGVELNTFFNVLMASLPGFVENNMRKALSIALELKQAEVEERPVRNSQWTDEDGEIHFLFAEEVELARDRVEAMKDRAAAAIAPFSKCIKTVRPASGRVDVEIVEIRQVVPAAA
jgi:hypothetical protein